MNIQAMFTTFPTFTTNRLFLRQIQLNDAQDLFATFSDESVMEFYGHLPHRSIDESVELIKKSGCYDFVVTQM